MFRAVSFAAIVALAACWASAATTLFDFEQESDVAVWTLRTPGQDRLIQSGEFATSGSHSMQFVSPPYKDGMEQWPAFEAPPPVKDWTGYDRLMVDIFNPSEERTKLSIFISDSKTPFRKGLSYAFDTATSGMRRFFIPLSEFPGGIDRGDISIIHFYSTAPADMRLCVDTIALLKPGEEPPPVAKATLDKLRALALPAVDAFDRTLDALLAEVLATSEDGEIRQRAKEGIAGIRAQVAAVRARTSSAPDPEALHASRIELRRLERAGERLHSEIAFREESRAAGMPGNGMVIGFATSMQKLLPNGMPFALSVSREVAIDLARNEKESFQVAVLPKADALKGVRVAVSDLAGPGGAVFAHTQIDCDVMGYVETKAEPPYDVPYVGWWPDPILDFLGPVDIAPGDLQSFWIRVRAPKGQAPGTYRGTLTVSADGVEPAEFKLTVNVHAFTMPDCTPLPTAITFTPARVTACTPVDWATMKYKYADFLADYYIDYDSLYRREAPDFEVLEYLHDKGRLTAFNFGYYGDASAGTIERFRPAYEKAKELGLLDHAYIYGFDECREERFPELEAAAAAFKKAYPEVLVMTTSYDHSYGLDSCVKSMDAWCPLSPVFDPDKAAQARAAGKRVWWYICCGPHHPDANWFIEYRAIEIRLLMGAMTAKYRPDGFLYYELSIWNANKPITSGPFTQWNPVSWTTYHGDGSIFCVGPGGTPLPTIRLENYRDGQEDFAYTCILRDIIEHYQSRATGLTPEQRSWLDEAIQTLEVPKELVAARSDYSDDPAVLYGYRKRVADMIDNSGMADADPWGDDFGVRGFLPK
ncbi:MAG: DUF4091 domain-containing protein [Sedimentisphaerales bacterium]|nr:DUF4091 domain-containing protein [Sedimentisphaerales bacterium]